MLRRSLVLILVLAALCAAEWSIETVDIQQQDSTSDLALDGSDNPYIVYGFVGS